MPAPRSSIESNENSDVPEMFSELKSCLNSIDQNITNINNKLVNTNKLAASGLTKASEALQKKQKKRGKHFIPSH